MLLVWDENAWQDYLWWHARNRRALKRINVLIAHPSQRHEGIGKPEALRYHVAG